MVWGEVRSTFVAIRTEEQQSQFRSATVWAGLAGNAILQSDNRCLGPRDREVRLPVAAADFGFSLKLLSGISLGMTGPREGSCHLPLL